MRERGNLADTFAFGYGAFRTQDGTWHRRRIKACVRQNRAPRPGLYGP
jgi:hypothetical protein